MSFAGSTLVLLADGTTKRIDQIAPGDKVASRDEHDPEGTKAAGTKQAKKGASTAGGTTQAGNGGDDGKSVEAVWVHDDVLLEIHIDGRSLTTTEDHPFWSVTDQQWERADHLAQGEHVLTGDGTYGVVSTPIDPTTAYVGRAYNLTVEDWHTYHVLTDGDRGPPTSVLVHNCPGAANWVAEGGDLSATPPQYGMRPNAYAYQSGAPGARSSLAERRGLAPQLEMPAVDGSVVTAKFDGLMGNEIIDRKLNPVFSAKAIDQARRQAATAAYNGFQAVWELPSDSAVAAAQRFMQHAGVSTILIRRG